MSRLMVMEQERSYRFAARGGILSLLTQTGRVVRLCICIIDEGARNRFEFESGRAFKVFNKYDQQVAGFNLSRSLRRSTSGNQFS